MIYSEKFSAKYARLRGTFSVTDERVFALLAEQSVVGRRVLDFGCGDGRHAFQLAAMGAAEVVGIDSSHGMIALASGRLASVDTDQVRFLETDGGALPFGDGSFWVVFSNFVLHHFPDVSRPFGEIARVLDRGGYFLGTFNTMMTTDQRLMNTEVPLRLGAGDFVTVHNLMKSDEEFREAIATAGMELLAYGAVSHPLLSVSPEYPWRDSISRVDTVICLASKR